jgi:hypothetical protein
MNGEPIGYHTTGYLIVKPSSTLAVHSREFSMNSDHLRKVREGLIQVFRFDRPAVNSPDRPYELRVRMTEDGKRWEGFWVEVPNENW